MRISSRVPETVDLIRVAIEPSTMLGRAVGGITQNG
jgi:hypothetical protein